MVGSYILLIKLTEEKEIAVGGWQSIPFRDGYYAYVGSAMGGLQARIKRHLKRDKKLHWHIDYLLQKANVTGVILCETWDRVECTIARGLKPQLDSISGFGCSDCQCSSHLFFAANEEDMKSVIMATLDSLDMQPGSYLTGQELL